MAPKPEKPGWIPDDTTNIVEPGGARKTSGWQKFIKPAAEHLNWLWNLFSRLRDFVVGESQYNVIIDSDVDEGDYITIQAYLADSPSAGDRVLIKVDQPFTTKITIPSDIEITLLKGIKFTSATNLTTSIELSNRVTVKGILRLELSHPGTITNGIRFNGDDINVLSAEIVNFVGTITDAFKIEVNKNANFCIGVLSNIGTVTNTLNDASTKFTNDFKIKDIANNVIVRSAGANRVANADDSDLLAGDNAAFYRNAGNLNAGTLPAARFNDTAHGNRGGGALHADVVAGGADGFMTGSDKTKLDGIEALADVNQSNAEIKTQYENNANTNAFTDADESKLDGIEALAEVNNISDTDATDLTDSGETTLHSHPSTSKLVKQTIVSTTSDFDITSTIPQDGSTPLIAEGDQVLLESGYTPDNAANIIEIEVYISGAIGTDDGAAFTTWNGSTLKQADGVQSPVGIKTDAWSFRIPGYVAGAGARDIQIRGGLDSGGNLYINRNSASTTPFGAGNVRSHMIINEYLP